MKKRSKELILKIKQRKAITLQRATEKRPILLLQYWKNKKFDSTKISLRSGSTNNISELVDNTIISEIKFYNKIWRKVIFGKGNF